MLELHNIQKKFETKQETHVVLQNITCKINAGESVAIIGISGSGKTTLLNIIGGLELPTSGHYRYENIDMLALNQTMKARYRSTTFGYVLQQFALIPEYSVKDNIKLALKYSQTAKKDYRTRIATVLEAVDLVSYLDTPCHQLSGGQQQRVAIARALVNQPSVILADEPTAALDKQTGTEIIDHLLAQQTQGKTVIIVTHDEAVAKRCQRQFSLIDGILQESRV